MGDGAAPSREREYRLRVDKASENVGLQYSEVRGGAIYIRGSEANSTAARAEVAPGYLVRINAVEIFSVQDLRRAVAEARQSHPADLYLVISDDAPEVPDGGWAANPDTAAPNPPQHASTQDGKQHSPPPPAPSDPPSQVSSRQSTAALEINTLLPSMEFFSPSTNSVHRHMLEVSRERARNAPKKESYAIPGDEGFWRNLMIEVAANSDARVGNMVTLALKQDEISVSEEWLGAFVDAWHTAHPHHVRLRNNVSDIQFKAGDAFWTFLCGHRFAGGELAVQRDGDSTALRPTLAEWNDVVRAWQGTVRRHTSASAVSTTASHAAAAAAATAAAAHHTHAAPAPAAAPATPPRPTHSYYESPHMRDVYQRGPRRSYHATLPPAAQAAARQHERQAALHRRGASPSLPSLSPRSSPGSPQRYSSYSAYNSAVPFDMQQCFQEI